MCECVSVSCVCGIFLLLLDCGYTYATETFLSLSLIHIQFAIVIILLTNREMLYNRNLKQLWYKLCLCGKMRQRKKNMLVSQYLIVEYVENLPYM